MGELINGRTPEEIKLALKVCNEDDCLPCPYEMGYICSDYMMRDALALIERLEAERDAAFRDIPHDCGTCKYWQDPPKIYESKDGGLTVEYCDQDCSGGFPGWVWRGVVKPPKEDI